MSLQSKSIVLAVGGGIAAYKSAILARELGRRGARVRAVMTRAATRFLGPVTLTGILGEAPVIDLWDPSYSGEVHVELGAWADALVVAPATANLLARMANGLANDAVTATLLCTEAPVLVAPAMHHRMWSHAATQANVATLRSREVHFVGPVSGALASGEEGMGRMAEPEAIADAVAEMMTSSGDLAGKHIVISAGPTHEAIDPVRFIGNRSSGRMGYALAERAHARGARVTLVSGPVALPTPRGVTRVDVRSALEMQAALDACVEDCDALIMAAAVADFRPAEYSASKAKKTKGETSRALPLVRNPDLLATLGAARAGRGAARPVLIGFAVETENLIEAAQRKRIDKQIDLVVANHASVAFEGDDNVATLVDGEGTVELGRLSKRELADRILDRLAP